MSHRYPCYQRHTRDVKLHSYQTRQSLGPKKVLHFTRYYATFLDPPQWQDQLYSKNLAARNERGSTSNARLNGETARLLINVLSAEPLNTKLLPPGE